MFNLIVEQSLRYRVIVIFLMFCLMAFGFQQIEKLSVDVLPDLNKPTITIISDAGSLPPIDIERRINIPIEQAVNSISGVTRIRSTANLGLGVVFVEFNWGSNLYQIRQQVSEKLNSIQNQLPQNIKSQMLPTSSIMGEIMLIAIRPEKDNFSPMQLREFADYGIRQKLLSTKGISQITVIGGEIAQLHVIPNFEMMQRLNISVEQLKLALNNFSQITNGNVFEYHQEEYILRHFSENNKNSYQNNYESYIENLNQLIIKENILLSQIATVSLKPKFKRGDAGFNGQSAVILSVQKQPNTDTLILTDALESQLKSLNQQRPAGIAPIEIVFRQADFIQRSIDNLHETLRDGAIIVSIILILFTLSGRMTLISLIAIPMSLLMSILIFRWFNLSINTMTLGGLAIAMGELVDDAVIDIENINRRLRHLTLEKINFDRILETICLASLEVRTGVVYATMVVILVCVPLLNLGELEGQLFKPLIFAYIVSIFASLLVAMILTPVLSFYLIGKGLKISKEPAYIQSLQLMYQKGLIRLFQYENIFLIFGVGATLIFLLSVIFLPRSFLPTFNEGTYTITLIGQPGENLNAINKITQEAEYRMLEFPEVKHVARRTGRAELDEHGESVHYSELDINFNHSIKIPKAIDLQKKLEDLPVNIIVGQPISHRIDHLLSGVRSQIAIKIFHDDLNQSREIAKQLLQKVNQKNLQQINIEKQTLVPEIQIKANPQKALFYNLTPSEISSLLKTIHQGDIIQQILIPDRNQTLDLVIKGDNFDPNALIPTPKGLVPIRELADIDMKQTPNQINREQLQRRLIISATAVDGELESAIKDIQIAIQQLKAPQGMQIVVDGQYKAQQTASHQLLVLSIVIITLISLMLYYKYQSFNLMFIIIIMMILSLSGGVIALWVTHKNLDIAGLIGFITLSGIATRSSLLKISAYLKLKQKLPENQALLQACSERLIPVLMTSFSAMFALIPLILNPHEAGKEILNPVATVIFGGLITNLILDSFITPILLRKIK